MKEKCYSNRTVDYKPKRTVATADFRRMKK